MAAVAIALLNHAGEPALGRYFGPVNPPVAAAICGAAGVACLWWLAAARRPAGIAAVATVEPASQILADSSGPAWRHGYLAVHLFLFGLFQLVLLRRYGFVAMLGFRLVYYLHWHLIWDQLRLALLF